MDEITRLAEDVVDFARGIYGDGFIPLHRPIFEGNERQYLIVVLIQTLSRQSEKR